MQLGVERLENLSHPGRVEKAMREADPHAGAVRVVADVQREEGRLFRGELFARSGNGCRGAEVRDGGENGEESRRGWGEGGELNAEGRAAGAGAEQVRRVVERERRGDGNPNDPASVLARPDQLEYLE